MQKGSAQLLLILLVLILAGFGIYFYQRVKENNPPLTPKQIDLKKTQEYSNQNLEFSFQLQKGLVVKEDSEEEFNKRGGGDFRNNFRSYIQYEPGKFLAAVVVLDKSNSYETNPFTIWVFNNDNNLTIEQWYKNYWYYPFVWGDFTTKGKDELAPKDEATISGQTGKSGVIDYQPGKPKFIYLSKDKKMYLFRIIGEEGDKILSAFKFINSSRPGQVCIQVITPAKNEVTGECRNFPTPCGIPEGWHKIDYCDNEGVINPDSGINIQLDKP